ISRFILLRKRLQYALEVAATDVTSVQIMENIHLPALERNVAFREGGHCVIANALKTNNICDNAQHSHLIVSGFPIGAHDGVSPAKSPCPILDSSLIVQHLHLWQVFQPSSIPKSSILHNLV